MKICAWVFLASFVWRSNAAGALYAVTEIEPSNSFVLLQTAAFVGLPWYWFKAQARPFRASFPMDTGVFLAVFWPVAFPFFL